MVHVTKLQNEFIDDISPQKITIFSKKGNCTRNFGEKIFNEKIQDPYDPSTEAMTVGGPIKCHGIPKSYGYKKLGYQGKHSVSINVAYTIIIIESCVEDSGSPVKTQISF